jgi:hypothetical protein
MDTRILQTSRSHITQTLIFSSRSTKFMPRVLVITAHKVLLRNFFDLNIKTQFKKSKV